MTKLLTTALAAVLATACFLPRYTAKWPYRGPMIEIVNPSQDYVSLSARDGSGRVLPLGTIAPRSKACRTWPFVHAEGQLITADRREHEVQSDEFNPWAFHGWRWTIGSDLEAAQVCGT